PCRHAGSVDDRASRPDNIGGGPKQCTGGLQPICLCQRRRFAFLRSRPGRHLSSRRLLCGSHSARREAGRSPGATPDQVRDGPEPQDRQGARSSGTPIDYAARQRGYRMIKRRDFITLLGGAAAWPLAARAQQGNRVRRIGVLIAADENDPVAKTWVSAFTQALADFGWTDGRNVRMDFRWDGGDVNRSRALAQELVGLQPDIILT